MRTCERESRCQEWQLLLVMAELGGWWDERESKSVMDDA